MTGQALPSVLVLGGGPDAEREVSLVSAKYVAQALRDAGHTVHAHTIDRLTLAELQALPGDVIFPVLHGGWGEGGPLQDLLAASKRPFVGCGPSAARLAMDKLATKLIAATASVPTMPAGVFNAADAGCPLNLPVVLKPVHEGSSVGVHICRTQDQWLAAVAKVRADQLAHPTRTYLYEQAVLGGRELTVGVLDGQPLPPIEIIPAVEFYDYDAKYKSSQTRYVVSPELPPGTAAKVQSWAAHMARALGVRHLCLVDFILDSSRQPWLLEVNTLPGFTDHSLFPMAAAHETGPKLSMPKLCSTLVSLALRDKN